MTWRDFGRAKALPNARAIHSLTINLYYTHLTRHGYEPECLRLRLRRTTQFTIKNKAMNGDSQNSTAAMMVSHPPCSRIANIEPFYRT